MLNEDRTDFYDRIAGDYHWLFDELALHLGTPTPGVRSAIAALNPGARILDAACGIGVDAVALGRRSFSVAASDENAEMVRLARTRIADASLMIPVVQSPWDKLGEAFSAGSFDALLCTGNSISHAPDAGDMAAAFRAFRQVLKSGGLLILDTHDWEVLWRDRAGLSNNAMVIKRDGRRCRCTFSWRHGRDFGSAIRLDVNMQFESCESAVKADDEPTRVHATHLYPFTRNALRQQLREANFHTLAVDADGLRDRYTAVAQAA